MKPRKWVIVVFACLLAAAAGTMVGVRYLEKSRNIERVLVQRLSAATGGEFSVGRVRLGFFSVFLENISASLQTNSLNASVHDIEVAFSLWKLIATRGDFGRSISKIILFSPALEIRLAQAPSPAQGPSLSKGEGRTMLSAFRNFPVQYLLVRKGTVTLRTGKAGAVVLGEDLSGRVWDEDRAVMIEVKGTMASSRKNLFVSAAFSKTGSRHRVSLRIDKVPIQRPLDFHVATVTAGTIDGVFEFSFPDSVTARTFESSGWLHVSKGTCSVAGYNAPITSIGLSAALANTTVRVDSFACVTRGVPAFGKGDMGPCRRGHGPELHSGARGRDPLRCDSRASQVLCKEPVGNSMGGGAAYKGEWRDADEDFPLRPAGSTCLSFPLRRSSAGAGSIPRRRQPIRCWCAVRRSKLRLPESRPTRRNRWRIR